MIEKKELKISLFGMGKMGLPLAAILAENGFRVIGVDVSEKVVDDINKGINHVKEEPGLSELVKRNVEKRRLSTTTDGVAAVKESNIHIILVPTLIDDNNIVDFAPVENVTRNISKGLKRGDIVITECTMPPGSTENLIPILEESGLTVKEDFGLAHCPERTMTGSAILDITKKYPKIIGALDDKTLDVVTGLYNKINEKGIYHVSSIKTAEAVKVFEGVYRDVNIALANELSKFCYEIGIDAMETFNAANSQPYSHIHKPGSGVGGHCIPYYPHFVLNVAKKTDPILIRTARNINDDMPEYTVKLIEDSMKEIGLNISESNILVMGLTFRGGVKEFRKSSAKDIIEILNNKCAKVYAYDPMCDENDALKFNAEFKTNFKDIDCLVFVTDHQEFRNLNLDEIFQKMREKIIIDGRQLIDPNVARKIGFIYKGIGRI